VVSIYCVFIYSKAKKEYYKLDKTIQIRIKKKLLELEKNKDIGVHLKKLNFWKLRVGDYRIIYEKIDKENKIIVLLIGHRKNVYDDYYRIYK
jgi:mRNA interferase RelE/StbE